MLGQTAPKQRCAPSANQQQQALLLLLLLLWRPTQATGAVLSL
jgi:hypothetical protein